MIQMNVRIKSENHHNIDVILDRLKKITKLEIDNKITYHSLEYFQLEWMLLSLIEINYSISIEVVKEILRNSIRQLAIANNYSKNYLVEQLSANINNHLRKSESTYILLSAISIKNLPFRKLKIGSVEIEIHGKQYPKLFRQHREDIYIKRRFQKENQDYAKVSIKIRSRDYKDAFEKAIEVLEVFRSLLCLILNSQYEIRFDELSPKPINEVLLAEVLSLHYENGACPNADYFHFVQNYKEVSSLVLIEQSRTNLRKNILWLVRQYNNCKPKHQKLIQKALNLYVSAFDECDKFLCFTRAWTVLEILTATDQKDLMIKRCISLFNHDVKPLDKQMLESLRQYRNEYVHEGYNSLDPLTACFSIQRFIYFLIVNFNLKYAGFFDNINEANLFLDNYTVDLKDLKTRRRIIDRILSVKNMSENKYPKL